MNLDFDFTQMQTVEFGVGIDESGGQNFYCVAVDGDVQSGLKEMAQSTWDILQNT